MLRIAQLRTASPRLCASRMKFPEPNLAIKRREDKTGYETPIGTLPSVTTILGATSSPEAKARLEAWLKRPGAHEESMRACKGGLVHEQPESYLQHKPVKRHLAFNGYPVDVALGGRERARAVHD